MSRSDHNKPHPGRLITGGLPNRRPEIAPELLVAESAAVLLADEVEERVCNVCAREIPLDYPLPAHFACAVGEKLRVAKLQARETRERLS